MKYFAALILFPNLVYAIDTSYIWQNTKGGLFDGKCIEIDSETQGKVYQAKVPFEKCKPEKLQLAFHFPTGSCLELDEATGGKQYLKKIATNKCQTSNSVYQMQTINGKFGCYHLDLSSEGKDFYQLVSKSKCDKPSQNFYFKLDSNFKGHCLIKKDGKEITVENSFCKPSTTAFEFHLTSPTTGKCFEVSPEGKEFYIQQTSLNQCRPDKTSFLFIKDKKNKSGGCFEVDSKTNGKEFIKKTRLKFCK